MVVSTRDEKLKWINRKWNCFYFSVSFFSFLWGIKQLGLKKSIFISHLVCLFDFASQSRTHHQHTGRAAATIISCLHTQIVYGHALQILSFCLFLLISFAHPELYYMKH